MKSQYILALAAAFIGSSRAFDFDKINSIWYLFPHDGQDLIDNCAGDDDILSYDELYNCLVSDVPLKK